MRRVGDDWPALFIKKIRDGKSALAATTALGVDRSTPYKLADRSAAFKAEWDGAAEEARKNRRKRQEKKTA